jgi:hypothetical protein
VNIIIMRIMITVDSTVDITVDSTAAAGITNSGNRDSSRGVIG